MTHINISISSLLATQLFCSASEINLFNYKKLLYVETFFRRQGPYLTFEFSYYKVINEEIIVMINLYIIIVFFPKT